MIYNEFRYVDMSENGKDLPRLLPQLQAGQCSAHIIGKCKNLGESGHMEGAVKLVGHPAKQQPGFDRIQLFSQSNQAG